MNENFIPLKNDVVFKTFFVNNKKQLRQFISVILDIPESKITDLEILNPEIVPEHVDDKFSRLDLLLTTGRKQINIELQVCAEKDYRERSIYYWARMCSSGLEKGNEYGDLKESISINLLGFNMFDCEEYHSEFKFCELNRHEILTDKASINFYELKKLEEKLTTDDKKILWLKLIGSECEEEWKMLENTRVQEISDAVGILHGMTHDARLREMARVREDSLHERAWYMNAAKRAMKEGRAEGLAEGMEKGLAEGRAEGMASVIEKMRASGMTEEQINKILSL